jgi:pantoate kinase
MLTRALSKVDLSAAIMPGSERPIDESTDPPRTPWNIMNTAKAFAPGNVSGVFKIISDEDPAKMHSLGMGFTVSDGVTVSVARDESTTVNFNGTTIDFVTVLSVVAKIADVPLRIDIRSELPLSGGFGLSGASALATAFAIDAFLDLGMTERELGMAAHVAEVENLTGLGDIAGQFNGGCLVKLVPGDPLAAIRLPVPEQDVYYRYFSAINTRDVIGHPEQRERINAAAAAALEALGRLKDRNESDFSSYIEVAKDFAIHSGLLADERVKRAIRECEDSGGTASMIMLGNAVFSNVFFTGAKTTRLARRRVEVVR